MIIRLATANDLDGCVAISHIPEFSYLHKAKDEDAKKYLQEYVDKGILIVAEDNDEIIGFISGEYMLGNFVWVDGLTVRESHRGKGIGKQLFQKFKYTLIAKGITHIYLTAPKSNEKTLQFYRSIGMKEGKEFVEFSEDL